MLGGEEEKTGWCRRQDLRTSAFPGKEEDSVRSKTAWTARGFCHLCSHARGQATTPFNTTVGKESHKYNVTIPMLITLIPG